MSAYVDVCERAADRLREAGLSPVVRRLDATTGQWGVTVRPLPTVVRASYYDGEQDVELSMQVTCRLPTEAETMEACAAAAGALDGAWLPSANGSYELAAGGLYVSEPPHELRVDEAGAPVWAARVGARATTRLA